MAIDTERPLHSFHIDTVKLIAILGIFSWHYFTDFYRTDISVFSPHAIQDIFGHVDSAGKLFWAVYFLLLGIGAGMPTLFIICSGYGLFTSHITKKRGLKDFYMRRALRILPIYWLALLYNFLAYPLFHSDYAKNPAHNIKALLYHFFLVQDYTVYRLYFGALWFIGCIAQFYVLFPLLARLYNVMNRWAVLALAFALTYITEWALSYTGFPYTGSLPTRYLPLFIFGMTLAGWRHEKGPEAGNTFNITLLPAASAVLAALMLFLADRGSISFSSVTNNLFYITIFMAVLPVSRAAYRSAHLTKAVKAASCATFIVFLVHQPVYRHLLWKTSLLTSVPDSLQPVLVIAMFALLTIPAYFLQRKYNDLVNKHNPR
ncbi:MAG: acyltransferase [Thermodesulfovibrionales bacterium]|nr:acyltransferase [Thermodesulfovibrionales bacterium]